MCTCTGGRVIGGGTGDGRVLAFTICIAPIARAIVSSIAIILVQFVFDSDIAINPTPAPFLRTPPPPPWNNA